MLLKNILNIVLPHTDTFKRARDGLQDYLMLEIEREGDFDKTWRGRKDYENKLKSN